jgi:DNA-binding beta-propeller fold protein YncE
VTVLDWGGTIDTTFNVGVRPMAIDNAPAGSAFEDRIYVVNNGSANVYCIDTDNNNAIIDTLRIGVGSPTPASPVDVAIAPAAQNGDYRGIVINTADKTAYVFTLRSSRPYHVKSYEEHAGASQAASIHSVTVIVESIP